MGETLAAGAVASGAVGGGIPFFWPGLRPGFFFGVPSLFKIGAGAVACTPCNTSARAKLFSLTISGDVSETGVSVFVISGSFTGVSFSMAILKYPHIAEDKYKQTIKALRSIGAIDYRAGDKLSKSQDYNLRKKAKEFEQFLKHPESFAVRKVSTATKNELKHSGLKATKANKAIIPLKEFETVQIKTTYKQVKKKRVKVGAEIVYKGSNKRNGDKVTETVVLIGGKNSSEKIEKVSKQKRKKNESYSIKVGDNATVKREFQSLAELNRYVSNVNWNLKPGQTNADIEKYISIVKIESAGYAKKKNPKK